jgi:hypothetical protein
MNNKRLLNLLSMDRDLRAIFSGIILTSVALISMAVTAGIWYL